MTGNTALVPHGILTENSHLRVHVCPKERRIYIFPTESGIKAIESNRYVVENAHQPGTDVVTARGCWVPADDIQCCICISPRGAAWEAMRFSDADSLSEKGRKALRFVKAIIKSGLFPGSLGGIEITDRDLQIEGMDIIISKLTLPERRLQVKCDYAGGYHGLYLQIAECNPFSRH